MKKIDKFLFIFLFCLNYIFCYSSDINYEDLEELLRNNIISQEDYNILMGENNQETTEGIYELKINGESKAKIYKVFVKNGKLYFPLKSFFENINFQNYSFSDENELKIYLGENLKEIILTKEELKVDKERTKKIEKDDIISKDGELYLAEDLFKEIFLSNLRIDNNNYIIGMYLNFPTPEEIKIRTDRTKEKLEEDKNKKTLQYTNTPELFELGYLRTQFLQTYEISKDDDTKKKDWEGNLEYQGAFLYGQLTANYDLKEKKFQDITLKYNEIWEKHTLEIGNYSVGSEAAREWGVNFKKDKGYIITSDKTYIIRENVPIGSRVELLYLGFAIDVQDEKNGSVEFKNSEIKSNREYTLKIYEPSGNIILKKISTTSDYNQQNKGQFEYNISLREDDESKKIRANSKIYYGLTDNLTFGLGYDKEIENLNTRYEYIENGSLEAIYNDTFFSYPYVLSYEDKRVFTKIYDKDRKKNTKDKNSKHFKGQIDINKLRLKFENDFKEKYYEEKRDENYTVEYRPFKSLELGYEYDKTYYYDGSEKNNSKYKVGYSKSFKSLLWTAEYEKYINDKSEYNLNVYYNGLRNHSVRLENSWTNDGKDYEVGLTLFSNTNKTFDYTFEARYSEKTKEAFTFRFNMKLNDWFTYEGNFDKLGNQKHKVGVDKIFDLKHPLEKVETLDSCRVKIITFIDLNDNNICDEDEPRIDNVKVKVGGKEVLTDKRGEGMLYGIPNHIVYDLNPTIRKPSFVLGNNKIKIRGTTSSTLVAYIPVKPLLTLTGIVNVDSSLNKTLNEKIAMFGEILIKVKDISGKVLDMAVPDETGIFEISGLLPKKYYLEIIYTGIDKNFEKYEEIIQLSYFDKTDGNMFVVNLLENTISLNKKGEYEVE